MNRKQFISIAGVSTLGLAFPAQPFSSDNYTKNKISLAQWSMNKSFFSGKKDPHNFAVYAANICLLYTSPSPRDRQKSRMPSSA